MSNLIFITDAGNEHAFRERRKREKVQVDKGSDMKNRA